MKQERALMQLSRSRKQSFYSKNAAPATAATASTQAPKLKPEVAPLLAPGVYGVMLVVLPQAEGDAIVLLGEA